MRDAHIQRFDARVCAVPHLCARKVQTQLHHALRPDGPRRSFLAAAHVRPALLAAARGLLHAQLRRIGAHVLVQLVRCSIALHYTIGAAPGRSGPARAVRAADGCSASYGAATGAKQWKSRAFSVAAWLECSAPWPCSQCTNGQSAASWRKTAHACGWQRRRNSANHRFAVEYVCSAPCSLFTSS